MKRALIAGLALTISCPAVAQDDRPPTRPLPDRSTIDAGGARIQMQVVARGLEHPWGLALLPDGGALVTERNSGALRLIGRDGRVSGPIGGVPPIFRFKGETGRSQAGLFDVKLHPDFARNRQLYLSLSAPTERGAAVRVLRARLSADGSRLEDVAPVFTMKEDDQDSSGLHFGGRLAVDRSNLFLTIGDRRNISRAQDGDDQAGSILRMTLDGRAPADNPHVRDSEKDDFVFAMGSRNSQALGLDGQGRLWSVEHGPKGGDRVDLVTAGANLGWPYITGGRDYSGAPMGVGLSHDGMSSPRHVFDETVAPSGLVFYRGAMFQGWRDNLLVGGLYNQALMRLTIAGDRVTGVEKIDIGRRVRDVQAAPDGAIWLITEHEDGELVRLTPAR